MTLHSWGAITPGMHNVEKLISYVKTCKPAHQRWKNTKVLIIDEGNLKPSIHPNTTTHIQLILVSMVDGKLFDTLAALADRLRKKTNKPFGGIQVRIPRNHAFTKIRLTVSIACHHR